MPSARRVAWAKLRVTAVSAAAVAILLTLFYLLAGGTLFEEKATLYLYIPDATGLSKGAPVRVDGIGVGQVSAFALTNSSDPNKVVKVTIDVVRSRLASIPVDSYAQISADTMVGDQFVDVSSGRSSKRMQSGGVIVYREENTLMKSVDLLQFEVQLRVIDATLRDIEQGRNRVGEFIVGEQMYNDLRRRLRELERGIREASQTTTTVGEALYTDRLYQRIAGPIGEFDRALARLQSGQGAAGQFLRDPAQYEQLRAGATGLRQSIAGVRAGAWMQSDAVYTGWTSRIDSLIRGVDRFNADPLMATPAVFDNLNGSMVELSNGLRDFQRDPRRFLRMNLF
jgi:phospholipid/cholesterol/gamma-HCH transport system substrate-binding protein